VGDAPEDNYGLSWQIIPAELSKPISGPDPEKSKRAMQAMLTMNL
jgi:predicted 3-demethylubiquinone-9 3-methyltransferase (glyoxalase superfamily)